MGSPRLTVLIVLIQFSVKVKRFLEKNSKLFARSPAAIGDFLQIVSLVWQSETALRRGPAVRSGEEDQMRPVKSKWGTVEE
jgi:hypothetical protein